MSLTVMRPRNSIASLTTSTRSRRCWCIKALARSSSVPSGTVTSRSPLVMMLDAGWSRFVSTGGHGCHDADDAFAVHDRQAGNPVLPRQREDSRTDIVGGIVIGFLDHAALETLDLRDFGGLLRRRHVLVHYTQPAFLRDGDGESGFGHRVIAAESSGMLSPTLAVSRLFRLTSLGTTRECAGTSRTSSNVSAFRAARMRLSPMRKNGLYRVAGVGEPLRTCPQ